MNEKTNIQIRSGELSDVPALTKIYNQYVMNSNAVFDTAPVSLEQRLVWFKRFKKEGPHRIFIAELEGKVIGSASSNPYRDHKAFDQTVEFSIHLAPLMRSRGVGSALYTKLISELRNENVYLAVAGIALPNDASVRLHKKFGFEEVGIFKEYAVKNGERISSVWLQRSF